MPSLALWSLWGQPWSGRGQGLTAGMSRCPPRGHLGVNACLGPAARDLATGCRMGPGRSPVRHVGASSQPAAIIQQPQPSREQRVTLRPCPRPWAGPAALRTADTPAVYTPANTGAQAQGPAPHSAGPPGVPGARCDPSCKVVPRTRKPTCTERMRGEDGVQDAHALWAPG